MTAEIITAYEDDTQETAARYLDGLRGLYARLGHCSCHGEDLYMRSPDGRTRVSAGYISGAVMIATPATGELDVYTMDDEGIVTHSSADGVQVVHADEAGKLFAGRLANIELQLS